MSCLERIGRGVEIRTPDLLRPRQARYQAALRPDISNLILLYLANMSISVIHLTVPKPCGNAIDFRRIWNFVQLLAAPMSSLNSSSTRIQLFI